MRREDALIWEHVAMAQRHIEIGLRLITRQEEIVARLEGHKAGAIAVANANELLATFVAIQKSHLASRRQALTHLGEQ
jgi:hypothetical protein